MSQLSRIQDMRKERQEHKRTHKLLASDDFDLV
ncbi:MAG: hypothetical protein JWO35_208 [Candidatus Saccharibacteria bacterium]|nr:hypothetical protein [Candidatus Saccharibacteria bacterium]